MKDEKKMNVLVIGSSGAGKTTLIKSIAGIKFEVGYTKKIDVYESSEWPIRFIDTKGFEYNIFEQWKTIHQIKKYIKINIKDKKIDNSEKGIDAVWYCIEGTTRRTFEYNINLMKNAIKGWKNIPIFVVITKSYSEIDIPKNLAEIEKVFLNNKKINLKKIIPVVAEEYFVNEEVAVSPKGIEQLCLETIDCLEEAKQINKENRMRLILNQKRTAAHGLVITATGIGIAIALADKGDIVDSLVLTPLEVNLTKLIFKIYGVKYSKNLIDKIIGGSSITTIAKLIVGKFDKTQKVDAIVAGTIIFVLGEAVIVASEASYKGLIELDKIDEYINEKINQAPIISKVINFLNDNIDKLNNSSSEEITTELKQLFISNSNN